MFDKALINRELKSINKKIWYHKEEIRYQKIMLKDLNLEKRYWLDEKKKLRELKDE